MRNVWIVIGVTAAAIMAAFFVCVAGILFLAPIRNDSVSKKTADSLANLPLPEDTELIEKVYKTGKLVGNGNGTQYFEAILIKSSLSLEELKAYYSGFAEHEWECAVENQEESRISLVEHGNLTFQTEMEGDEYYIVYSWGSNQGIFHELDLRGH
ncbi:MAG: hypothetical protein Q4D32_12660 [Eubacteriales bacterium]|nr:hypothetical protein [Eubacteriales bacterium]